MRRTILVMTPLLLGLTACAPTPEQTVEETLAEINGLEGDGLEQLMLQTANPSEAVNYFARVSSANPGEIGPKRGLAQSLVRAGRFPEGVATWREVTANPASGPADQVGLADALLRSGAWDEAEAVLDQIPPTHETFERYRLEAMVADSNEEWQRADSFYEIALGLTTTPAGVMNNWGFSKLTRGDHSGAEALFTQAIQRDPTLFTAKNNLVLARGAQRNYDLPVIPMDQVERAQLLHTSALSAIKQGDVSTGRALLKQAIDTHPRHFEAASRSLAALESGVTE